MPAITVSLLKSSTDIAWDCMTPVIGEFGRPDFERLMQEDFDKQAFSLHQTCLLKHATTPRACFVRPQGGRCPWKTWTPGRKAAQENADLDASEIAHKNHCN